jgi:hypothetical protein
MQCARATAVDILNDCSTSSKSSVTSALLHAQQTYAVRLTVTPTTACFCMPECPLTSRQSSALAVTVHSSLTRQRIATAEAVSRPLYSKAAETAVTVAVAVAVTVAIVLESSTLCAALLWLTAGNSGEGHHLGRQQHCRHDSALSRASRY